MLKLRRISIRNWLRVRDADIVFPASGLVLMLGQNHTAATKLDSVGSGKTALGEAIVRPLFGAGGRYTEFGQYSFDEAGDTCVTIEAELDGRPLRVESGFRHESFTATGEGLRFWFDGAKTERPKAKQTRQELVDLIGVAPNVVPWTIFLDGEHLRFNRLSHSDALELLMQAMNQPRWQQYHERATKESARCDAALQQLQNEQSTATAELGSVDAAHTEALAALTTAREAYTAAQVRVAAARVAARKLVETTQAALTKAADARDVLHHKIKAIQEADAAEFGRLALALSRLESERATAARYLRQWGTTVATTESELAHAREHVRALTEGTTCPTCRRHMDPDQQDVAVLRGVETSVLTLTTRLTQERAGLAECQQSATEIDADITTTRTQQAKLHSSEVTKLSIELEAAERVLSRADRAHTDAQLALAGVTDPSNTEVATATVRVNLHQDRQTQLKTEIAERATRVGAADRAAKVATYWARGFSPEGIPNTVLRQTIPPLNDTARLVSEALAGGAIQVQFSADTELADGRVKPRLVTSVVNRFGAQRLAGNSKGEAGLANLIIAETQTHVGRIASRVGFRWFDEAVNSQDPVVRRSFYSYLRRQAHERGILIFVVDHHNEVAAFADHILVADKSTDGYTTYRWE